GPDWQPHIDAATRMVASNIDYLQARHVQVRVVFMPEGTWEAALPFSSEYHRQLRQLCAEKNVPIIDWSKLLPDEVVSDAAHPDINGMKMETRALLDVARPFLHSTGAIP